MFKNLILILAFFSSFAQAQSANPNAQYAKNYILNGDFETGATNWTFNGSIIKSFIGTPIEGKQSLQVGGMPNASYFENKPITVPIEWIGRTCAAGISVSGVGPLSAYLTLYDGASEINTSYRQTLYLPATGASNYTIYHPCPVSGLPKLRVVATANSNNLVFDKAFYRLASFTEVPNVTSWQNYTPTITANSGSLTNYTLSNTQFMQVGENIFLRGKLTFTGAVGTWSRPRVSLPNSYVIDNNVASVQSGVVFSDTGTNRYGSDVYLSTGSSYIEFQTYRGANGVVIDPTQAAPFAWTSTDTMEWNVGPIKIVGLSNSATVLNVECPAGNPYQCEDLFTAHIDTTTITNDVPKGWLSAAANPSTGIYNLTPNTLLSGSLTTRLVCWGGPTQNGSTATNQVPFWDFSSNSTITNIRMFTSQTASSALANRTFVVTCRKDGADFRGKKVLQADISNTMKAPTGMKFISTKFTCSSSSTLSVNTGEFSAVGNVSGGGCSLTIASGVFSTIYGCHVDGVSGLAAVKFKLSAAPTTTSVNALCQDNSTGCAAWDGFVSCWGM